MNVYPSILFLHHHLCLIDYQRKYNFFMISFLQSLLLFMERDVILMTFLWTIWRTVITQKYCQ